MNKPKALKKGDKVAIVSLSSGILGEDFCSHYIELGKKRLEDLGLKVVFMPNALKGLEYIKNHPEKRAEDLKNAFKDDEIKGIFAAIGGEDTYKTVPFLLEDKEFIRLVKEEPKVFSGFSDTTTNHLMFYKLNMLSFYGLNYINDFCEMGNSMLDYSKKSAEIYFGKVNDIVSSDVWYEERIDFSDSQMGVNRNAHKEIKGYELIKAKGNFKGELLGGCLESLISLIEVGESDKKYDIFPSIEEWKDKILFIETSEEQPSPDIYKIYIRILKNKGIFSVINGMIVGKPQDEKYYEEYKEILINETNDYKIPILYNVNFGHAYPRAVIPYGIMAEVCIKEKRIKFLENIVEK